MKTGSTWWLDSAGRSYEQMRVTLLEFLDTDVFNLSPENCVSFMDPLIESWDVDLTTFAMEIVLNRRVASGDPKRYEFVEREPDQPEVEPGFKEFLNDSSLSGTATKEEIELLRKLTIQRKTPYFTLLLPGITKPQRPAPFSCGKSIVNAEFIRRAKMSVNIQYVGFKSTAILREYSFLLRESLDRAERDHLYDFERGIPLPWFTLSRCAGPLLTETPSRDGQLHRQSTENTLPDQCNRTG